MAKNCDHFWLDLQSGSYLPIEDKILQNLVSNPIHNFQLLLTFHLLERYFLNGQLNNDIFAKLQELKKSPTWPKINDFGGAIHSLLRLQYTYRVTNLKMTTDVNLQEDQVCLCILSWIKALQYLSLPPSEPAAE